ncbi:MAG: glycosyltransferase [Clostridia bacterium]|nr:glycosyltransferase [Clostridia bacterium]
MKKFKICQFSDTYYPIVDGVVQVVHNTCNQLAETDEVCLIAPKARGVKAPKEGAKYNVIRCRALKAFEGYPFALPKLDFGLKKMLKQADFDVYHAQTPFSMGRFARRMAKANGVPMVATLHTKYYDDFMRVLKGSRPLSKIALKYIMKVYNNADCVWLVSKNSEQIIRDYGYTGRVEIIRNGTDFCYPSNAEELINRVNEKHGLLGKENVFAFVGRTANYKNIRLIADSLKILKDKGVNFTYLVVGGGFDLEDYKKYVKEVGIAENTIFTGILQDRELLQGYYLRSDLFLFPSEFDTSGLVTIEAAAHKLPAVLVEGTGAAEEVIDGFNGFLTVADKQAYADKILQAINDKAKLNEIGDRAHKTIYRSWQTVAKEVRQKYAEVIEEYKRKNK